MAQKFGTHPHPVYKNIQINNDGIDIQTNENEEVRAVFDGLDSLCSFYPRHEQYGDGSAWGIFHGFMPNLKM